MIPLRLEAFGEGDPDLIVTPAAELEAIRRAAWDEGHAAGLADADTRAEALDRATAARLAEALQDAAFTFHEARTHVLSGTAPLILAALRAVLPPLAADQLAPSIVDALQPMLEADHPVTLFTTAEEAAILRARLAPSALPLTFAVDDTLAPGRARLTARGAECAVDPARAADAALAAMADFFTLHTPHPDKACQNG
ncbi:hypothetical protein [Falsirhodobacter halotolerans]|uniref:FliH/SctL family protein n=1 Tax=Falsirhodobacter halotolerans TaxID=1146892 RepID=UPI001FD07276|nr:hypothetical protein [Falsirhodobacter halotolerans]MCJ8140545.1 hypothetical protein [Falsirhodobacter halotolerans]